MQVDPVVVQIAAGDHPPGGRQRGRGAGPSRGVEWAASRSDLEAVFAVIDGSDTRLTTTSLDFHVTPGTVARLAVGRTAEK